ncbi:hypothetical protein DIPPA_32061 [Diplonema papillatum]|nr:hypothetical protein DIPPA_32061 [Diplonema papillatum]
MRASPAVALLVVVTGLLAAPAQSESVLQDGSASASGWQKPKAPAPRGYHIARVKKKVVKIREPSEEPPEMFFPVAEGRQRANSVRWVADLLNQTRSLVFSGRRLRNGCRMVRMDWRRHQVAAMRRPLSLPFAPVDPANATERVDLPIERMMRLKAFNSTVVRAYVDPAVWLAKRWVFFDLGARFFLRTKPKRGGESASNYGSLFQFMCGYPGAEKFEYHAVDINDLSDGYPSFVQWKTAAVWNASGAIEMKGDLGAGSHVVFAADADTSAAAAALRAKLGGAEEEEREAEKDASSGSSIVSAVDLSAYLREHAKMEDFVVVKMDIENAEFLVIDSLFATGAIRLIDEMFLECHGEITEEAYKLARVRHWVPDAWVRSIACRDLEARLRKAGTYLHEWD